MNEAPVLFFLHGLGCSARTWDHVVAELGDGFDCVALDLPGHGAAAGSDRLTVEQMADSVTAELLERRPQTWALVGHSMGGKIATIVTASAERGIAGLSRPFGLVLVASSPLGPEPMDDATRAEMIGWCAHGQVSAAHAREFVGANIAGELPADRMDAAVADVQRVSRNAWLAWLERGSREDWGGTVDIVRTPTLVVAGAEDGDLGVAAQRTLTLPRVAATEVVPVGGAAHLIALEQAGQLAALIAGHVRMVLDERSPLPADVAALIGSDRVSARTREALLDRLPEPHIGPDSLDENQRGVLSALVARVVPQRGTAIDIAARIDAQLAAGTGDGWRFAELPADLEAWRRGLDTLAAVSAGFVGLPGAEQDRCIERLVDGDLGSDEHGCLSAGQMTLWFDDVRAEAVRAWMAHPAAMARVGYDGFANGGDGLRKQGYLRVGAGERESWQRALPVRSSVDREPPVTGGEADTFDGQASA